MRVLIEGGTGFVGKWLQKTQPKRFDCYYVGRRKSVYIGDPAFEGYGPDYVIHLAPTDPDNSIGIAERSGARLLYASSGIVYHPENDTQYREDKLWGECVSRLHSDTVIARLFTFYGDGLDDNKAITQFLKSAKAGQPLRIWGDGSCVRSYMHGEKMARWLWAILLRGESGQAYDIGSDKPVTMLDLARHIQKVFPTHPPIHILGGRDAMPCYLPVDTAKTRALLDDNHSSV